MRHQVSQFPGSLSSPPHLSCQARAFDNCVTLWPSRSSFLVVLEGGIHVPLLQKVCLHTLLASISASKSSTLTMNNYINSHSISAIRRHDVGIPEKVRSVTPASIGLVGIIRSYAGVLALTVHKSPSRYYCQGQLH